MAVDPEARYLGELLCAASLRTPGLEHETAIPCRRRPGRKRCPGFVHVMLTEVPERFFWRCPACGDHGSDGPWRDAVWNLRDWQMHRHRFGDVTLRMTEEEYRVLRWAINGPCALMAVAERDRGGIVMRGDLADAEDLLLAIGELPPERRTGKRGRVLSRLHERVAMVRLAEATPTPARKREILDVLSSGHPPDDRVRGVLRQVAAILPVPFEARLGRATVSIDTVFYWEAEPPELRARTRFRGDRVELNLGAFRLDDSFGPTGVLLMLYRHWWLEQKRRRRRGG